MVVIPPGVKNMEVSYFVLMYTSLFLFAIVCYIVTNFNVSVKNEFVLGFFNVYMG